jgi:hypothetical protein
VLLQGASADGLETVFMMSDPHPALKAQFLIFCGSTGYEYFFVNGAYRQNLIEKWLEGTVPNNSSALIAEVSFSENPSADISLLHSLGYDGEQYLNQLIILFVSLFKLFGGRFEVVLIPFSTPRRRRATRRRGRGGTL